MSIVDISHLSLRLLLIKDIDRADVSEAFVSDQQSSIRSWIAGSFHHSNELMQVGSVFNQLRNHAVHGLLDPQIEVAVGRCTRCTQRVHDNISLLA